MIPPLFASLLSGVLIFHAGLMEDQRILRRQLHEQRIQQRLIAIDVKEAVDRFHKNPVALQRAFDELEQHWGRPVGQVIVPPPSKIQPIGMRNLMPSSVK